MKKDLFSLVQALYVRKVEVVNKEVHRISEANYCMLDGVNYSTAFVILPSIENSLKFLFSFRTLALLNNLSAALEVSADGPSVPKEKKTRAVCQFGDWWH